MNMLTSLKIWPLALFLGLLSCNDDETPNPTTNDRNYTGLEAPSSDELVGNWTIVEFKEEGIEHPELKGLTLQLKEKDELLVVHPQTQEEQAGMWRIWKDDGRTEFELKSIPSGKWAELNDDWYFIHQNGGQLRFEDPLSLSLIIIERI